VTLLCRRVAIINRGRLLAIDSPEGLQRAAEATNQVLLRVRGGADDVRDALVKVEGVHEVRVRADADGLLTIECGVDARDDVEAAIARAVAERFDLHRLERRQPTLENVFLRYVSAEPA
jgi:ABC-2 type transport system ATP-binding protein